MRDETNDGAFYAVPPTCNGHVQPNFCMDSSAIPTSLGVNPSLTIAAVCERAAERLVGRGPDFGLPARPAGFRHRAPGVHVGARVKPG